VGELYLRLASRRAGEGERADEVAEARRAFGEIVEFAPDDPAARRRLGDLLRAHGWFAEALRQYETLARLTPDDAGVWLLVASAAEGLGKLEAAVKWTEKAGSAGGPGDAPGTASTARALAATYLAWGRLDALAAGRADEAARISARLARLGAAEGPRGSRRARAALTWAHPDLHPSLWSDALGAPLPAPEGDPMLGIAEASVPARDGLTLEVRLPADEVDHAARLGATATLTVVYDEGEAGERAQKLPVAFARGGPAVKRFVLAGREVREKL
jgi:Ca-activated chloride channel family protein